MSPSKGSLSKTPLYKLRDCLIEFDELRPRLELMTLLTFIAIAENPGTTSRKIADVTGQAQSSVSRNTVLLGDIQPSDGRPIMGLIRSEQDPAEMRRSIYTLTPKGIRLAAKLRHIIEE